MNPQKPKETGVNLIGIEDVLVEKIIDTVKAGFQMAQLKPVPVGISQLPQGSHEISAFIGMVGKRNGTVALNLSQRAALFVAKRFAGVDYAELHEEVLDAVGEITNIIAGQMKAELDYGFVHISCPSMIIGGDYRVYHFQGFSTVSVEFLIPDLPSVFLHERYFSVTLSLSKS